MKKIAIFTSARSDFGLLRRVITLCSKAMDVDLLVADLHQNSNEIKDLISSLTIREVPIAFKLQDLTDRSRTVAIACAQTEMAHWLEQQSYASLIILGDRWELFAASVPALMFQIPIAHISGGEITEGAIDDSIRHAHSKLASLHFVANRSYATNLSRMGEQDWRITISGECGLDSMHHHDFVSREEVLQQHGIDLNHQFILVTFHPSTNDINTPAADQIDGLLNALNSYSDYNVIFTSPGMENGTDLILSKIHQFVETHANAKFVANFGSRYYLTVLRHANAVLGNSSSGLVEAASFGVPAVNVGLRQRGRLAADSVLNTGYAATEIATQLSKALSESFQQFSRTCVNPYDPYQDGRNSERIVFALQNAITSIPRNELLEKKLAFNVQEIQWNTLLKGFQ